MGGLCHNTNLHIFCFCKSAHLEVLSKPLPNSSANWILNPSSITTFPNGFLQILEPADMPSSVHLRTHGGHVRETVAGSWTRWLRGIILWVPTRISLVSLEQLC